MLLWRNKQKIFVDNPLSGAILTQWKTIQRLLGTELAISDDTTGSQ